jgi:3-methyl-2-oxobutanoate hydroxymethyltransferase
MATYYFDGTNGDDANAGTSEALAWKSFDAKFASTTNNDVLYFKRGNHPGLSTSERQALLVDRQWEMLLLGDSLAQVIYGLPSTLPVTLDMMIAHGAAVVRGSYHSVVLVDMPFGSYEASPQQAFASASRVMAETGCAGVKLEGGEAMAETIRFLTQRGIPVMAHIGLTPQAVNALGGYGARGKSQEEHAKILGDARAVAAAGAFGMVVEGVMEELADIITTSVDIPVIGIGASARCDGQVLVAEDMLGMFERTARFVKRYANLAETISQAAESYAAEVRNRSFPGDDQVYRPKK